MDNESNGNPVLDATNLEQPGQEVEQTEGQQEQVVEPVKQPELKKLKQLQLKVHGEMVTEDLPFELDDRPEVVEYLTKQLQLSKAAQRAMQENQSTKQAAQQLLHSLKSNTRQSLMEMGIDPKEFAAAVIEEELKNAQMTPEERERIELQSKVKGYEEQLKKKEEEFQQKELERLTQMEYERLDKEMTEAISRSDLPKEPYVIEKMARYMNIGISKGVNITPDEALGIVREEMLTDLKKILSALPEDKAEEFIGKEVIDRFRKKNLAKAKVTTPATTKAAIKDIANNNAKPSPVSKKAFKDVFGNF